jgi:ubiquinone/menaquinone biosynthesis C-methylase UbiE
MLGGKTMARSLVQEQFGANAAHYVTSRPHAKGASLQRLLELVEPQADWRVLDVATAAGHTAFAFAPHVAQVWATDITEEMLKIAAEQAAERGFNNVKVEYAEAGSLPYEDGRFDLVTCRIAPHHFPDIAAFIGESRRVLRPGGLLAVVDNVVPVGLGGDYVNAFEKFRDPSHGRCLALEEWLDGFSAAGLELAHYETLDKQIQFESWASRHDADMQRYLKAVLFGAPVEAAAFFQPQTINDETSFRLQEGIIIGRKTANNE